MKEFQPPAPSRQPLHLTRIVPWSHQLICDVLQPGDRAVDLTAGKGRDTLVLAQTVGMRGQVIAFDLQHAAIDQTADYLRQHGYKPINWPVCSSLPDGPGVYLVESCHSHLDAVLQRPVNVVTANLGYLPGGNHRLVTRPDTTLAALEKSLGLLVRGGRLAVTVYPSHSGGAEEARAVDDLFENLPQQLWQVLLLRTANRPEAPYLLVAERHH